MILKTTWLASTPNPATGGYRVYRSIDGVPMTLIATVPPGTLEFSDSFNAPVGTHNYQYGVSGLNTTGQESAIGLGPNNSYTINEPTPSQPGGVDTTQTG